MDGEDRWGEEFVRVREIGEELSGGKAGGRNREIRSDFCERDEDECALGKAGMRDFQNGLSEDKIAVEEDIEVEGAGSAGDGGGAIAAERSLDGEERVKQWARCEIGFKSDDGVEETRLIGKADGLGGIERRTRSDAAEFCDLLERGGQRGVGRACGAWKVGAEGDVDEQH